MTKSSTENSDHGSSSIYESISLTARKNMKKIKTFRRILGFIFIIVLVYYQQLDHQNVKDILQIMINNGSQNAAALLTDDDDSGKNGLL